MGVPHPAFVLRVTPGPRAARAEDAVRDRPEVESSYRTAFQRDRDRIIHTKAFRRLKHKTQVFVAPEGDHYRTRLTHTLEVSAIARTVARALGLNEDLVEAISMGHDLGHAPFGHAGESALDAVLESRYGRRFFHNQQSVRIVEVLEGDGRGLNLTREVRDGIRHHTGPHLSATLEGQVVRLVDRVAYVNHDIEDALRAGVIALDDLPPSLLEVLGDTTSRRITRLVDDIVEASRDADIIRQSDEVAEAFLALRAFMFERVYLAPPASEEADRARHVVTALFEHYVANPGLLPPSPEDDPVVRATDFVSGMTDRYALRAYAEAFLPREGPL